MAKGEDIHIGALDAASAALAWQLHAVATEQGGYVHKFPDGKLSIELEWVCIIGLARAAVAAYLAHAEAEGESD
jgi:hypothetical protein